MVCEGSGDVIDRVTKLFRPCSLCRGKGFVRVDAPEKKKRRKHSAADTTIKVIDAIREYQKEYLDTLDVMTLKPMRLKDIAKIVKVDQATVYKSVQDQRINSVDVSDLFNSEISGMSNRAVMQIVSDIVKSDPSCSDLNIMNALHERGIDIARRTIAKYRKVLSIPKAKNR